MPEDPTSEFASPAAMAVAPALPHPQPVPEPAAERGFFGHPRGLATLFFTELWERFSYYGMRAILILFMTATVAEGGMGMDTARAGAIYGLYTALVYLMALPGGWIADRFLGQRRAVLVGGIVIALGHFSMAAGTTATFYLGLTLIVLGTGLLKPNISTMVGELYPEGGARRDAGFSIFYMGINTGAFVSPLVVGFLGERVDWHVGFGAAGVGMVLGLVQYVLGGRHLGAAGLHPDRGAEGGRRTLYLAAGGAALVIVATVLLHVTGIVRLTATGLADAAGAIIAGIAILYFLSLFVAGGLDRTERARVGVIFILFLAAAAFWAGFEQAGSSFNLFAERLTDLNVFGWEMPASWFQSVNSLFIIFGLAAFFAWLWVALGSREPSSPAKFAFGLFFLGLGFLVMMVAAGLAAGGVKVSPWWLVLTYFLHTVGELCLSPVGLSTVTKLAPHRKVGQMMGVWFMGSALGNLIAGRVGGLFEAMPLSRLFGIMTAVSIGLALLLAVLVRPIRRLMHGVH
jgi:POT family proton-dependent oligopeptide transporter